MLRPHVFLRLSVILQAFFSRITAAFSALLSKAEWPISKRFRARKPDENHRCRAGCRQPPADGHRNRGIAGGSPIGTAHSRIQSSHVVEHQRVEFPSFAYEWCPEMLHEAGRLTIQIALDLLPEGIGLKDGTPYNVLFQGPNPVFIDVLSFERRDQHDPMWLPYAQFVRTFLLPLLANKHYGVQLSEIFTTRRDGLEHEDVYRWTGPLQRLKASVPIACGDADMARIPEGSRRPENLSG